MRLALALLLALAGCSTTSPPTPEPAPAAQPAAQAQPAATQATPATKGHRSDIDIADFAAKQAKGGIRLIDVRTPPEYASGHVAGAVSVPLDTIDPSKPPLSTYPKDQPLYVICETGGRSSHASDELASAGYQTINVEGGTRAWIAAGHPVEK